VLEELIKIYFFDFFYQLPSKYHLSQNKLLHLQLSVPNLCFKTVSERKVFESWVVENSIIITCPGGIPCRVF
jgi:hypothetical protein